jgi:hypothetical protein
MTCIDALEIVALFGTLFAALLVWCLIVDLAVQSIVGGAARRRMLRMLHTTMFGKGDSQ